MDEPKESTNLTVLHKPPYRQIRALYDDETITVYQAYNAEIASEAVRYQKLNASPLFRPGRMTWIKPSWCWMMYRSGYAGKDKNQERILALKMKLGDFTTLLEKAVLTTETPTTAAAAAKKPVLHNPEENISPGGGAVKVQWDPERSSRLARLDYRSIQIGIRGSLATEWVENHIVSIEDVTGKARGLKRAFEDRPEISDDELVAMGLLPAERSLEVSGCLREVLGMDRN